MSTDPSVTKTLRREFGQRLRGVIGAVSSQARTDIVDRDIFGLGPTRNARRRGDTSDPAPADDMWMSAPDKQVDRFGEWLRTQLLRLSAELFTADRNPYIRSAYIRGMRNTDSALREQGVDVPTSVDITVAVESSEHKERLQSLNSRTQREWEGVIAAVVQAATRELDDGLTTDESRREIARRISDRMQKVAKKRATDLAETEIVRAASEGNLQRAEQVGVEEVAAKAEYLTAADNRVCETCAPLHGEVMSVEAARGLVPQHPRCRCHWWPHVEHPLQLTFATADT